MQPTAGVFVGREHQLPVRIYYEDTDFTGLVYHANYLRFCERGRSDFLRAVGVDHTALLDRPDPCAFVIVALNLKFHAAARIDDALLVRTTYDVIKGPRLLISQRITRGETTLLTADVEAACITIDGRPRRPPADLVEKLKPLLAP
jgi:acyl-CoA thioester hydrolase